MSENVVVSANWLANHLDEVTVVDVREPWEYEGIGHIPGAVNIPFDAFRSAGDEDEGMLPGEEQWADLLGDAGIDADTTIVTYDDTHGVFAARFLVTAELYGHHDLHLLDGDFSAWTRTHETTTDVPEPEPAEYDVRAVPRAANGASEASGPRADGSTESLLVSRETVEEAVESDAVLVDTRTPEEFAEGHIRNAVNVDWVDLVDDETRGLKPHEEREDILTGKGITPEKRVVLYCNTARRISHTYVVLRSLGYENIAFYEGSLTEWNREGGELVTGEE